MRSPEGSSRGLRPARVDLHAVAVRPPAAVQQDGAGLADEPDAEPAGLEHEPGAGVQLARLVADEVAEQADERARTRRRRRRRRRGGRSTFAPRWA